MMSSYRRSIMVAATAAAIGLPVAAATATATTAAPSAPQQASASSGARSAQLQGDFAAAAARYHVPVQVLMAVSYIQTRWDNHDGQPSVAGGYGPMHLTDMAKLIATNDRAPGASVSTARGTVDAKNWHAEGVAASTDTLPLAMRLTGASRSALRADARANVSGGAAVLASYAKALNHGSLPTTLGGWYAVVAKYSGSSQSDAARSLADDVFALIRTGAARTTMNGQKVTLRADPAARASTSGLAVLALKADKPAADTPKPQCPKGLGCTFIPAAYAQNSSDPGDYGNYDLANRPAKALKIHYIVIHDTEESYADTISGFQNPASYVSAHYVVRSSDGHVTQMVQDKNVAWQAGNWYINMHSIGIEHEGYADAGGSWYTEEMYQHSAKLVAYLAKKYDVPLDREHIIGHENVPGILPGYIASMHWDPGPFWDWNHYMSLVGAKTKTAKASPIVQINPYYGTNRQIVDACGTTTPLPSQPTSFVWLRTAPNSSAPLISDPGLHPDGSPGTVQSCDWGDKASAGQQYVVAGSKGSWTAIWTDGMKAWFYNPASALTATPVRGWIVKPRTKAGAPVYGRAYPEQAAYKKYGGNIPYQDVEPLPYTLAKGQAAVYGGPTPTDYYYAKTINSTLPDDHTDVVGSNRYYEVQIGHRIGFVMAKDVLLEQVGR